MSSIPSADAKAVVRAIEALATQVRRALTLGAQQDGYVLAPPVGDTDDAPTTPATTCSAQNHEYVAIRQCIRAAQHPGVHIDDSGHQWPDAVAVYPTDSTVRIAHWHPVSEQLAGERQELANMVGAFVDAQVRQARTADEAAQGTARRQSIRVLLNRLNNGLPLGSDEAQLLTRHVAAEITNANQLRAGRATWKAKAEEIERDRDRLLRDNEQLLEEQAACIAAEKRADTAERELRVLRAGLRANGADPTQIQNLWAQIRLRNRQWRDAKRELEQAQAAIERVRKLASRWGVLRAYGGAATELRAALDATEQPTTEQS